MWKVGDLVVRPSYGRDICFMIVGVDVGAGVAILKGLDLRLIADAPFEDLAALTETDWKSYQVAQAKLEHETLRLVQLRRQVEKDKLGYRSERRKQGHDFFELPGRVLHLDGDGMYLEKCLEVYRHLGIHAVGKNIPESSMASVMTDLLVEYDPDILIITGHDSVLRSAKAEDALRIDNYRNSDHFIRAVKAARKYERSLDELIIFAGACQSHYEALLESGANFASSPERILIHALDPVFLAEQIAFTPISETIDIFQVVKSTITGTEGLGGIESRGKYRIGLPRSRY
ncbi:MAG: sporulation peptidase YabG [Acidibacillus sp.]|uniref:Sporulation-specific protease YabG n=1 Tax=Sulfoacidibacillus ferrooxidans TaxID=2005001 RepID=A0A9X1V7I6_9BACL|nr:Sporulation-specific protease YabG [Sulfoacidibacillus ferrooxidans]MCY0894101.1 sporulation peptidase YabG [Acidibacillus sp.]